MARTSPEILLDPHQPRAEVQGGLLPTQGSSPLQISGVPPIFESGS